MAQSSRLREQRASFIDSQLRRAEELEAKILMAHLVPVRARGPRRVAKADAHPLAAEADSQPLSAEAGSGGSILDMFFGSFAGTADETETERRVLEAKRQHGVVGQQPWTEEAESLALREQIELERQEREAERQRRRDEPQVDETIKRYGPDARCVSSRIVPDGPEAQYLAELLGAVRSSQAEGSNELKPPAAWQRHEGPQQPAPRRTGRIVDSNAMLTPSPFYPADPAALAGEGMRHVYPVSWPPAPLYRKNMLEERTWCFERAGRYEAPEDFLQRRWCPELWKQEVRVEQGPPGGTSWRWLAGVSESEETRRAVGEETWYLEPPAPPPVAARSAPGWMAAPVAWLAGVDVDRVRAPGARGDGLTEPAC